jgi:hypothetical protein
VLDVDGLGTGKFQWKNCFNLPYIFPADFVVVLFGNSGKSLELTYFSRSSSRVRIRDVHRGRKSAAAATPPPQRQRQRRHGHLCLEKQKGIAQQHRWFFYHFTVPCYSFRDKYKNNQLAYLYSLKQKRERKAERNDVCGHIYCAGD